MIERLSKARWCNYTIQDPRQHQATDTGEGSGQDPVSAGVSEPTAAGDKIASSIMKVEVGDKELIIEGSYHPPMDRGQPSPTSSLLRGLRIRYSQHRG